MARKAYILFPNEANHSGGFAPHSVNPSPYATASGNRHLHITVEAGPVTSDSRTESLPNSVDLKNRNDVGPVLLLTFLCKKKG